VTHLFGYSYKNRGGIKIDIFDSRRRSLLRNSPRSGPYRGFAESGTPSARRTYGEHSVSSFKSASVTSILIITQY